MNSLASKKTLIPGAIVILAIGIIASYLSSDDSESETQNVEQLSVENKADVKTETISETNSQVISETKDTEEVKKPAVEEEAEKTVEEIAEPEQSVASTSDKISTDELPQQTVPEISFVEGSDYITKFPNEQPKSPVLVEFFSYMCPHCFNFEPTMKRWINQKPDSVKLLRVPVTFGRTGAWGLAGKSFYIAQELNMVDQFSTAIFRKIHIENKPPRTEADIGKIFLSLGVDNKSFAKAAKSFNVNSNIRKAEFLTKKYKVSGVPYFLINNKYETGKDSYESEETLFRLWNNLPNKDFK